MDEFQSNVTQLVNVSKTVEQPVNISVALSRLRAGKFSAKIGGHAYQKFVFAILTAVSIQKQKWSPQRNVLLILQTEDEIGEFLVKKDSKNTQHATWIAVRLYLDSHSCNKFVLF